MMRQATKEVIFCLALVFTWLAVPGGVSTQITALTGTLPKGATYLIEVPANWNEDAVPVQPRIRDARRRKSGAGCWGSGNASLHAVKRIRSCGFLFKPGPYLRPFDSSSEECASGRQCGD